MRTRLLVLGLLALGALVPAAPAAAAGWCGTPSVTDRPAVLTGHPVRVVYTVGADAPDRSVELAPRIWADVETIDGWWRGQDSSRTPRFDLATFPCGLQVDLTFLRLAATSGDLRVTETRHERVWDELAQLDGADDTKFLVYYDGPVDDDNRCGEGAGYGDGMGAAVIYLAACQDVATATVAAHELLHAMGAAAALAPNACPQSSGHVCDGSGDILHQWAQYVPLSSFVLDLGRNDYYGHGGTWLDVQRLPWLRRLEARSTVTLALEGTGSVTSDVPGIACTATCTTDWDPGSVVELEAQPAPGSRFVRWTGGCDSTYTRCALTLDANETVSAVFAPARFQLTVRRTGNGAVTGGGVACGGRCAAKVTSFEPVTLRATARKGWRLKAWTGACRGAKATCTVPMRAATTVGAVFARR